VRRRPRLALLVSTVLVAVLAAACSGSSGTPSAGSSAASGAEAPAPQFMVDQSGRVVVLHGVNFEGSSKDATNGNLPTSPESQALLLKSVLGFDAVRFLIFWSAIEPTEGHFDQAYLNSVAQWVDFFGAHGIHVILDMHQDIYSSVFDGDGAPAWAVFTDGQTFTPAPAGAPWEEAVANGAVQAAYENFWDPSKGHPDLQANYIDSWVHVAERFAHDPTVLGFDLMNEPGFANGDLAETLTQVPEAAAGTFHNPNLTGFFQRTIDAVRKVDTSTWLYVEPTSLLTPFPYAGDLLSLHDPRNGPPRLGYAPHLYDANAESPVGYTDFSYVPTWASFRVAEAAKLPGPLFIGEFGRSGSTPNATRFVDDVTTMADQHWASWTWWSWDPGSWSPIAGSTPTTVGQALMQVYPTALAGNPGTFSYDPTTRVFDLTWTSRSGVGGPTELAVPSLLYPGGFTVHLTGGGTATPDAADQSVAVVVPPGRPHALCLAPTGTVCTPPAT